MSNLAKLENDLLSLSPAEREQLALAAWESLGDGSDLASVAALDPEGIEIAKRRDKEISECSKEAISHDEFLRQISGTE
jgi:hypothetical protein